MISFLLNIRNPWEQNNCQVYYKTKAALIWEKFEEKYCSKKSTSSIL